MLLNLEGNNQLLAVGANDINRHGSGTSAYQVEGCTFEEGSKATIFDTFAHTG